VDHIVARGGCAAAPFEVCAVGAAGEADVGVAFVLDVFHFGGGER
jgi:hypothetical protein